MAKFRDANGNIVEGVAINEASDKRIQAKLACGLSPRGRLMKIPADDNQVVLFNAYSEALESLISSEDALTVLGKTTINMLRTAKDNLSKGVNAYQRMKSNGLTLADFAKPAPVVETSEVG